MHSENASTGSPPTIHRANRNSTVQGYSPSGPRIAGARSRACAWEWVELMQPTGAGDLGVDGPA